MKWLLKLGLNRSILVLLIAIVIFAFPIGSILHFPFVPNKVKATGITISEFSVPSSQSCPSGITTGPDGNLWFTELCSLGTSNGNKIGKITTGGVITEYTVPTINSGPAQITTGPDGNLWFTEQNGNKIGKITTGGVITEYTVPTISSVNNVNSSIPYGITTGPDGNLWFTEEYGNKIGKITTGGVITEYPLPPTDPRTNSYNSNIPSGITTGPDGNLWFAEGIGNKIGKITTGGVITEYPLPSSDPGGAPYGITSGPDGNLWFGETIGNHLGKITTGGVITEYTVPTGSSNPAFITSGPDGNLWFTESNKIGRITTGGVITEYTVPTTNSGPSGITTGPDGNLWFTEENYGSNKIGRVNFCNIIPTPTPSSTNLPPTVNQISDQNIGEGTYSTTCSFTDTDSTSWTATIDYGDGSGVQPLTLNPDKSFNLSHVYKDEGTYTVTISITDNQGATGTGTATVTVNNAPFTVSSITAPTSPTPVNTAITASSTFTDPGVLDTHTASWNWGDGSTTTGTVTESNGSGSVSNTHTYTAAGVYTVTLTVTDDEGVAVTSQPFQYVVIYDPSAGFFTGSGTYTSLAGWDLLNPNATGTVIFGISAKYQTNSTTPTGTTKLMFKVGDLTFSSTSYSWLVVNSGKAYLTGTGTITGSSDTYNLLVTGLDASQTIRFQLKDNVTQNIVYDTQPGASAVADPTTTLTSGQIKVH